MDQGIRERERRGVEDVGVDPERPERRQLPVDVLLKASSTSAAST
jgi:hypothetical protein